MVKYTIKRYGSNRYIFKDGKAFMAIWENTDKAFLEGIGKEKKKAYIITHRQEYKTIYGPLEKALSGIK
jgi:hypothetical protein